MDRTTALQTAARQFCMEQHAVWLNKYVDLQSAENFTTENYFSPGWTYSEAAYSLFPRYRLAEGTLLNIEGLFFDGETSQEQVVEALFAAGREAYATLFDEFKSKTAALEALKLQAAIYNEFVRDASHRSLDEVQPLAYRRVLTAVESEELWNLLKHRWNIRGAGYGWFPMTGDPPPGTLTFHEELWNSRSGQSILQRFLMKQGTSRCFLLRELGPPNFEIDVGLVNPAYDGSEAFLFSDGEWVLYSSHESSFTLTGPLAEFFRREWTDAEQLAYAGPFHTADLRGSWNLGT